MPIMKWIKFTLILLAILSFLFGIFFVLRSEYALVMHPKGIIAQHERNLIITNYLLMFTIVIPTFIILFIVAWRYRAKNSKAQYDPDHSFGVLGELMLWVVPSIVIAVMIVITWYRTYELDPYQPLKSEVKPLTIQVVALDWKWLFIYPEQQIAAVNFVQFPAHTPIRFELAADGSPMNSFWIPQLSGQIYAMTGMVTPLHIMADELGEYSGRASEINGMGYAGMIFVAKATSQLDFDKWVESVKQSGLRLTEEIYDELVKPSENNPVVFYSYVKEDLFNKIVMRYMPPQ